MGIFVSDVNYLQLLPAFQKFSCVLFSSSFSKRSLRFFQDVVTSACHAADFSVFFCLIFSFFLLKANSDIRILFSVIHPDKDDIRLYRQLQPCFPAFYAFGNFFRMDPVCCIMTVSISLSEDDERYGNTSICWKAC